MTREEAIELLEDIYRRDYDEALRIAIEVLNLVTDSKNDTVNFKNDALPSAEARPTGEWIIRTDNNPICRPWYNTCNCSKCGQYGTKVWNYCPNCGADMR